MDDQALEHMDTDLHPQEDTLGELMRCLALVENMEDDSSGCLKWQEDNDGDIVMVEQLGAEQKLGGSGGIGSTGACLHGPPCFGPR